MATDIIVSVALILVVRMVWRAMTAPEARCGSELPPAAPPVVGPTALRTPDQFDREILDYMRSKMSEDQRDQQWQRIAKAKADAERSRDEFEARLRRVVRDIARDPIERQAAEFLAECWPDKAEELVGPRRSQS